MINLPVLASALALFATPAAAAGTFASDWSKGQKSAARLIAAGGLPGAVRAGIEIALDARTHTYWRAPGDAGVPPLVSFEGSDNLASAELLFPAPQRMSENGALTFGYDEAVVLPLAVSALDGARPVTLAVKIDYAACERICVPAQAMLRLVLPAGGEAGPHAAQLAQALARVPQAGVVGGQGPLAIVALAYPPHASGAAPRIEIEARVPAGAKNLFVAPLAPEGWFMQAGEPEAGGQDRRHFVVSIEQMPAGNAPGVQASFVLVADGAAIEVKTTLDLGRLRP